jgi:hypothetical protein
VRGNPANEVEVNCEQFPEYQPEEHAIESGLSIYDHFYAHVTDIALYYSSSGVPERYDVLKVRHLLLFSGSGNLMTTRSGRQSSPEFYPKLSVFLVSFRWSECFGCHRTRLHDPSQERTFSLGRILA